MKKITVFCLLMFFSFLLVSVVVNGEMQPLVINGKNITLKDGTQVKIDTTYKANGGQFRAVWISAYTGEINTYSNEESYKLQFVNIFEKMEYFHLNAMLFHVRIKNDALYESKYNSYSAYYSVNADWDPLPWIIEECHKRGIEFHAWMNPYRVSTDMSKSLEEIAKAHKPTNAAYNPDNLLKGSNVIILDPGIPTVRNFLVNTCMELVENYDIDAIHFDDYFYAAGIDDSKTRQLYNYDNLTIDNFRRLQIDLFIEKLSNEMRAYNLENNKRVQLGISPTGSYRSGNGVVTYDSEGNAISNGSNTGAYNHYGSPLYADTVKWINEEWIDYIVPQTYWGITNTSGPFCELASWWDKIVKYKKVNLYIALGLYMSAENNNASWSTNPLEGYHQIMYANTLENVKGICIYNYATLSSSTGGGKAFQNVSTIFNNPVIPVKIRTMPSLIPNDVTNLTVSKGPNSYNLSFGAVDNSKFYVIYRSLNPVTFSDKEIIDIIGQVSTDGKINYPDTTANSQSKYYYGVKVLSKSHDLSSGKTVDTSSANTSDLIDMGEIDSLYSTDNLYNGEVVKVFFKNYYYPFGSKITYKLTYDFGDNQTTVTSFGSFRNMKSVDIKIPKDASVLNVTVEVSNNVIKSVTTKQYSIGQVLPKITNFGAVNDLKVGPSNKFVFNSLRIPNTEYTIQYSTDLVLWTDLLSVIEEEVDNFNVVMEVTIPDGTGSKNFRVKASNTGKVSFSDVLKIEVFASKDNLFSTLKVNDIRVEQDISIVMKEKDILSIQLENTPNTSYTILISTDYTSWVASHTYGTFVFNQEGSTMKYTVPINFKNIKMYIKIIGITKDGKEESHIIELYCHINYPFSDDVSNFFSQEISSEIKETKMFN